MAWPKSPMHEAVCAARRAFAQNEVPVGAVVVTETGEYVSVVHNRMRGLKDPTAHAELLAIRLACRRLGRERLLGCDLYVTLEPCAMCAAAIGYARFRRVYFGAYDSKMGAVVSGVRYFENTPSCHHPEIYGGICESESEALLKDFFRMLRKTS